MKNGCDGSRKEVHEDATQPLTIPVADATVVLSGRFDFCGIGPLVTWRGRRICWRYISRWGEATVDRCFMQPEERKREWTQLVTVSTALLLV